MKMRRPLDEIFSQQGKVRVLRHLATTRAEQHGRAIAADLGMSPTACHQILRSLEADGVVQLRIAGKTHLYGLNADSYIVSKLLLPLFERERALLKCALKAVADHAGRRALSVVLFGSVARGEERHDSDMDILIVVENKADLARVTESFIGHMTDLSLRFGHMPIPIFRTRRELFSDFERRSNLINEILRDGRLIRGRQLYSIIMETRRQCEKPNERSGNAQKNKNSQGRAAARSGILAKSK